MRVSQRYRFVPFYLRDVAWSCEATTVRVFSSQSRENVALQWRWYCLSPTNSSRHSPCATYLVVGARMCNESCIPHTTRVHALATVAHFTTTTLHNNHATPFPQPRGIFVTADTAHSGGATDTKHRTKEPLP